ncbi:porin family protein, partial [Sediminibacterium sp.]|uniref:porin family protein n=1 Tax=Sediminibacterium sp. TaxID=1917865 RepID=UPI003F6964D5
MKQFFLFLVFVFSVAIINAQTKSAKRGGVGITLSPILSDLSTADGDLSSKTKFAFSGGLFFSIPVGSEVSIQPELTYAKLGGKWTDNSGRLDLDYLLIPVLATFRLEGAGFHVYAGPQYGILLSAKDITNNGSAVDVKEYFKSGDFSLVGGAEFIPKGVGVGLRYQLGLSNIVTIQDQVFGSQKLTNNA